MKINLNFFGRHILHARPLILYFSFFREFFSQLVNWQMTMSMIQQIWLPFVSYDLDGCRVDVFNFLILEDTHFAKVHYNQQFVLSRLCRSDALLLYFQLHLWSCMNNSALTLEESYMCLSRWMLHKIFYLVLYAIFILKHRWFYSQIYDTYVKRHSSC